MDLAELNFYYNKLLKVKEIEAELEKLKIEAMLASSGSGLLRGLTGSKKKSYLPEG